MLKCALPTDVLHSEAVFFVEIGNVVLAAELHAVGGPNRRVVHVEEAFPVRMDVLWTLFPFTGGRANGAKQPGREEKEKK